MTITNPEIRKLLESRRSTLIGWINTARDGVRHQERAILDKRANIAEWQAQLTDIDAMLVDDEPEDDPTPKVRMKPEPEAEGEMTITIKVDSDTPFTLEVE